MEVAEQQPKTTDARPTVIGPIPLHHLRSLHLIRDTAVLIPSVLPHAYSLSWNLASAGTDAATAMLEDIQRVGGLPASLTKVTLKLSQSAVGCQDGLGFTKQLAAMLQLSSIQHLRLLFFGSHATLSGTLALRAKVLLTAGMPTKLVSLMVDGPLMFPRAVVSAQSQLFFVPWPETIKCVRFDSCDDSGTGGPGYFAAAAVMTIPERMGVRLSSLQLLDVPMDIATVQERVFGCFSSHLTSIKIAFTGAAKIGPIIHKFVQQAAATCKHLTRLHLGTFEPMSTRQLLSFAIRTMPLLKPLPIDDFGLLTFGLNHGRGTAAVLVALISCVPNVCSLDLMNNFRLEPDMLEPIVQRLPKLRRLILQALPDLALNNVLSRIINDRATLFEFARTSSILYIPVVSAAIQTAPVPWVRLDTDELAD
ncbi:hypothetical protein GGF31_004102 [Allomyces arbusculus]|nr:hypothetical protein GGF31_004102 [Allomyces arbusculus]